MNVQEVFFTTQEIHYFIHNYHNTHYYIDHRRHISEVGICSLDSQPND